MATAVERASSAAAKNICFRCKKEGHWAKDCPARESGNGDDHQNNEDNDDNANPFNLREPEKDSNSINNNSSKSKRKRKRPHVTDMMLMGMDPAVSADNGLEFVCKNASLVIPKLKSHRHSGKEVFFSPSMFFFFFFFFLHYFPPSF